MVAGCCRAGVWRSVRPNRGLADGIGGGRRARCGLRLRYSPRLGFPRRRWKSPRLRALATERLAERGARIETQHPTADSSARTELAKGELGSPPILVHRCTAAADAERADTWRAERISAKAESRYAIDFSCDQGCFLILHPSFGAAMALKLSASNSAVVSGRCSFMPSGSLLAEVIGDSGTPRSSDGSAQHRERTRLKIW